MFILYSVPWSPGLNASWVGKEKSVCGGGGGGRENYNLEVMNLQSSWGYDPLSDLSLLGDVFHIGKEGEISLGDLFLSSGSDD